MDLQNKGLFRDASLANLTWLADGATFDAEQMEDPTDGMIDNLGVAWGEDPGYIGEIGSNVVERNVVGHPDSNFEEDVDLVVRFAREKMLEGKMGAALGAALREKFPKKTILASARRLKKVLRGEGIVGTVVIDAEGFESCREALKFALKSPYRGFIRCVMNCKCGSTHEVDAGGMDLFGDDLPETSGNVVDDFLADDQREASSRVSVCYETSMPVIAGMGDLSEESMDSTLIDLINMGHLSESEAKAIQEKVKKDKKGKNKPAKAMAAAFKIIAHKARVAKAASRSAKVDVDGHVIKRGGVIIDPAEDWSEEPLAVDERPAPPSVEVMREPEGSIASIDASPDVLDSPIDFDPENRERDLGLDGLVEGSREVQIDFDPVPGEIDLEEQDYRVAEVGGVPIDLDDEEDPVPDLDVDHEGELLIDLE